MPWLFGWAPIVNADFNKTFDVALHMGTLLGAVIYFRHDLWRYLIAWGGSVKRRSIRTTDERIAWALIVGTIPGVIAGAAFESVIQDKLGAPLLISIMLAIFGVILYVVDRVCSERHGTSRVSVSGPASSSGPRRPSRCSPACRGPVSR